MASTLTPLPVPPIPPPAVEARLERLRARPVAMAVDHLGKQFPRRRGAPTVAIGDLSFSVHRREFLTVVGPSGCGKSTLIRLLAGLEAPTSGRVLVEGNEVCGPGPDRGMVFQSYTLFPWLTVVRNVMFGPQVNGRGGDQARAEALQWLELVGLEKFADHYPHQLSGGMKQRVAIARALANQPRILLMDEPFGALDAQTRTQMQAHLMQIWRNVNITIVFITHDLDEAVLLADRVLVLGANPGHLKAVVDVPLPQPRNHQMLYDPLFGATRHHLDLLIHGRDEPPPPPVKSLPMIRLTQVGDDID